MKTSVNKYTQIFLFFLTTVVLAGSFYFEYAKGWQPCPLCLMQRLCVFLLGVSQLIFISPLVTKRFKTINILQIFLAACGLFFVGRQFWLQAMFANQTPICLPGLDALIRYFPWTKVAHALFWGTGDCAQSTLKWLGISTPMWSAIYFALVLVVNAVMVWRKE